MEHGTEPVTVTRTGTKMWKIVSQARKLRARALSLLDRTDAERAVIHNLEKRSAALFATKGSK